MKNPETSKKDNFRQKMQKVCKLCSAATIDVYVRNTLRLVKLLDPQAKIIPSEGGFLENPKIKNNMFFNDFLIKICLRLFKE